MPAPPTQKFASFCMQPMGTERGLGSATQRTERPLSSATISAARRKSKAKWPGPLLDRPAPRDMASLDRLGPGKAGEQQRGGRRQERGKPEEGVFGVNLGSRWLGCLKAAGHTTTRYREAVTKCNSWQQCRWRTRAGRHHRPHFPSSDWISAAICLALSTLSSVIARLARPAVSSSFFLPSSLESGMAPSPSSAAGIAERRGEVGAFRPFQAVDHMLEMRLHHLRRFRARGHAGMGGGGGDFPAIVLLGTVLSGHRRRGLGRAASARSGGQPQTGTWTLRYPLCPFVERWAIILSSPFVLPT
jgi:hypothetical protein